MNLTTITPYWNRPHILRTWVESVKDATFHGLTHLVYFVGEPPPDWWDERTRGSNFVAVHCAKGGGLSIGHYHNLGAKFATSMWMMKLDVDALPHEEYFRALMPVLFNAKEKEWFNGGMVNLSRESSYDRLARFCRPLRADTYRALYNTAIAVDKYKGPKASNFICRRQDYLDLGGCDARFRHHSWQDYQQIYMLEKYQQGKDPLPGEITSGNVTDRCRDEIGRPKALELFQKDDRLCLLHHWHAPGSTPRYLSREGMDANRKILLEYILQSRGAV